MVPVANITHATTQRLRIKVPSRKSDHAYFDRVREQFSAYEGIESIETNPMTGSILFVHKLTVETIAGHAKTNGMFELDRTKPAHLHDSVSNAFKTVDKKVSGLTGGGLDAGAASFLALAGFGIYQIGRGNFAAPAWYTVFWYAFNVFLKSKPDRNV